MDIDEILERTGSFGRYQIVYLILMPIIQGGFTSWHILSSVFILYEPPHWCKTEDPAEFAIPIEEDGTFAKCSMYKMDDNETDFTNQTIGCVNGWVYDESDSVVSLVTELDLVCDKAIMSPNAVSIYFCGVLFGALLVGQLSDTFGRKTTTWFCLIGMIVFGVALAFVRNYIAFVIIWFILAIAAMGTLTCAFILLMELFPPKQRTVACCISATAWGIGLCVVTPIAYWLQNWRHFQLAISLPVILALPLWWFVIESPRWLQTMGRDDDVRNALAKIAKFNGVDCSFLDQNIDELQKQEKSLIDEENEPEGRTYSCFDTVKTPNLRKCTILLCFMWAANSLVYYGLALNSSSLAGNRFLNFFILGLAEVPAYLFGVWAMPRYGRRQLILGFHLIATGACIMTVIVPTESGNGTDLTPVITTMAFIGKLCITLTYTIVWIYSTEMYPTVIRTIGIGECSMMARIGGIAAPYVMYTGKSILWMPMVIFAVLSAIAGFCVLLLPETLNRALPQSIEDGENLKEALPVTLAYSRAPEDDEDGDTTKV